MPSSQQPLSSIHQAIMHKAGLLVVSLLVVSAILWMLFQSLPRLVADATPLPAFTPLYLNGVNVSTSIAVGDVNGDGTLDIVQGNYADTPSKVYLNDGHGGFGAGMPFDEMNPTWSIALGDVNGDGALDIVQGNLSSDGQQSRVYLNDGTGHFGTGRPFGGAYRTFSVALGDVNGDGALDIVQGNDSWYWDGSQWVAVQSIVYLNDGTGQFDGGTPFGGSHTTGSIVLGDVNGDGTLDIVQGNTGQQSKVYLNDGAGHFGVGQAFGGTNYTVNMALGDVNGDDALDIVQDNGNGEQSIIYLNDGAGHFSAGQTFGDMNYARSIAVGDVNDDGVLDIIQGNLIYLNDGAGRFGASQTFGNADDPFGVALGDVNGDGALDIVQGNNNQQSIVYLNNGTIHFSMGMPFTHVRHDSDIGLGDVNGDGALDVVQGGGAYYNGTEWIYPQSATYLNDGTGHFDVGTSFGPLYYHTQSIALGDLNGDNTLDIVQGYTGQQSAVYLNDGAGRFVADVPFGGWYDTSRVTLGDMNGDGAPDIVQGNYNGTRSMVYLNDGIGQFDAGTPFGNAYQTTSIALGDVNGDGLLDVVQGNTGGGFYFGVQSVVYLNDGTGRFEVGTPFGGANNTGDIALGDVNGDGTLDVVQSNSGQQSVVYLNDGMGDFDGGTPFGGANSGGDIALGDVNGDGSLDIVQGNLVYLNEGAGRFSAGQAFNNARGTSLALGDVNGDGAFDIVQGNVNQQNKVYLNTRGPSSSLPNNPSTIALISPPSRLLNANFVYTDTSQRRPIIPFTYTVSDREGDLVRFVRAYYSLEGGGQWLPAVAASGIVTTGLTPRRYFETSYLTPTIAIPDNGVITSTLLLTSVLPLTATDVNVWVAISHTQAADLRLVLQAPHGESLTLLAPGLLSGPLTWTLLFDDAAPMAVVSATAPYSGTYRPTMLLLALNGLNASGTWTLQVQDTASGETGAVQAWGLLVQNSVGLYVYNWDVYGSGFFGQSDNVVFRLEAYPSLSPTINGVPVFQYPYASVTTFPFRVRGTQVRVGSGTQPISNAIVYRLPAGQSGGGSPLADAAGVPFHTDGQGYLQGRGELNLRDQLLALAPVHSDIHYEGVLDLDGVDDYASVNPLNVAPITATTVSFWMRSDDRLGQGTPFSYATASHADEVLIANYNNFEIYRGVISVTTGISATDGLWHHVAVTWREADGQVKLYKDGLTAYTGTLAASSLMTGGSLVLGQDQSGIGSFDPARAFKGSLDGIHVWNIALDEAHIQADRLDGLNGHETDLVLDWSFDAPVARIIPDRAANHNDGALFGAIWTSRSFGGYTVYHTNGAPTEIGLSVHTVTQTGVQTLTVSASRPLILFDLDVALEWDAHKQTAYLQQLKSDVLKSSAYLYDFTNGQVALGHVTVHQNADDWLSSQVVVYATNRLRPLAVQGGIVTKPITDPQRSNIAYAPGQVRMGAVWNRYGEPGGDISDWPLALAHELSHYLLYQEDVYLGLSKDGLLIPMNTCTGSVMGDMYNPDNTEFIYDQQQWDTNCANTLAQRTLGRTEWTTNRLWYPWLITPTLTNAGPSRMPFDLTRVTIEDPISPTNALDDPTFYIDYQDSESSSSEARAYLLRSSAQGDYILDLGSPLGGQNRVYARGAQPGDRLCVFDAPRHQFGCETIELGDERLRLKADATWRPVVQLTPVNSQTIAVEVSGLAETLTLNARLYPENGFGGEPITLIRAGAIYSGAFHLDFPAMMGKVQIWVDEPATEDHPRREALVTYSMGGNPGNWPAFRGGWPAFRGGWPAFRGGWSSSRSSSAPLTSPGGQMLFFTADPTSIQEGNLYTIESMAGLPPLPTGKTAIGQGYSLIASPNVAQLITGSISFQYLSMDVLTEQANENQLMIHFWKGQVWQALDTVRSPYFNMVSAPSHGPGVYALLTGVTIPQLETIDPVQAVNDVTATLTIGGRDFLPPVDVLLIGPTTTHTLPIVSVSPISITAVLTPDLPAHQYQVQVVNRYDASFYDASSSGSLPFALYDSADACFYDFFESGSGKWQRSGLWDIIALPNGTQALTDSPGGSYGVAVSPTLTATTGSTSAAFSLSGCPHPVLTFRHDYVIDNRFPSQDGGRVEISTDDGATWHELARYTGGLRTSLGKATIDSEWTDAQWKDVEIDLSAYTGTVRLRFDLEVDRVGADRGWVIDDVLVRAKLQSNQVFLPVVLKGRP